MKQILCWAPAALRGQILLLTPPAAKPLLGPRGNKKKGCIVWLPKGQDTFGRMRKRTNPFLSLALEQQKGPTIRVRDRET